MNNKTWGFHVRTDCFLSRKGKVEPENIQLIIFSNLYDSTQRRLSCCPIIFILYQFSHGKFDSQWIQPCPTQAALVMLPSFEGQGIATSWAKQFEGNQEKQLWTVYGSTRTEKYQLPNGNLPIPIFSSFIYTGWAKNSQQFLLYWKWDIGHCIWGKRKLLYDFADVIRKHRGALHIDKSLISNSRRGTQTSISILVGL